MLKRPAGPRDRGRGRCVPASRLSMTPANPDQPAQPHEVRLTPATRVLVLQPSPGHAEKVRDSLIAAGDAPEVTQALRIGDAVETVLGSPVDALVLIDGGDHTAVDEITELHGAQPELPIVVVAAEDDRESAVRMLRAGAQDVVLRDGLGGSQLSRALRFAIERQSEDTRADPPGAARFAHRPAEPRAAERPSHAGPRPPRPAARHRSALLVLDLDGFKAVNDRHGHEAGDTLLVGVAKRISSVLRTGDTAARFGGDEFVVLCEDVDSDHEVVAVAQRIAESLAEPFPVDGRRAVRPREHRHLDRPRARRATRRR